MDSLAVTGNGHIPHNIDISNLFTKIICHCLGRLRHTLHKLFFTNIPLIILAGSRMDHCLANLPVGAADPDVLIRAPKTALAVAFKMGE